MFVRSLTLGVAAVALMASGAQAADLFIPTTPEPIIVSEPSFGWDGLYAGVEAGGFFYDDADGSTPGDTFGVIGGVVGANFIAFDPILVGVEVQADYIWGEDADAGLILALARVGAVVTDQVVVYAAGGAGSIFGGGDSEMVYALGGGVEFAVTENVSLRGEVLGIGAFEDTTFFGNDDQFFDAAKATVGVFYHF
jgi:outer membrane immunogenic protein